MSSGALIARFSCAIINSTDTCRTFGSPRGAYCVSRNL